MINASSAEFIFATCQPGAEALLKREVSQEWPMFKLAYSRPGFLTFKVAPDAEVAAGFDLKSMFARSYGISLGRAEGSSLLDRATFTAALAGQKLPGKLRLNVFERLTENGKTVEIERQIRQQAQAGLFLDEPVAQNDGEVVLDVVVVEDDEWWIGWHLHSRKLHRPWVGGIAPILLPKVAPSRAYLKLEEGLVWSGLPMREKDRVLELGCAPGGASLALLERGLEVLGVDPADMDQSVLARPAFRHVRLQAKQLRATDLGGRSVEWLVSDMNVAPQDTIEAIRRALDLCGREQVLGALLTLKLNAWSDAEAVLDALQSSRKRLLSIGFSKVRTAHLFFNRHEVSVACYTPTGEERRRSEP